MKPKTLYILNEVAHVALLEQQWKSHPQEKKNALVLALAIDIEEALTKSEILFLSAGKYKTISAELLVEEERMVDAFLKDLRWKSFIYRGVDLVKIFRFMFHAYVQHVCYYSRILIAVVESQGDIGRFVLFAPTGKVMARFSGILAQREVDVVIDSAKAIARFRNVTLDVISPPVSRASVRNAVDSYLFTIRRALFGIAISIWNAALKLVRPAQHPRVIISDHWRNVGSIIELLNTGECIFLDRTEIRHMPWRILIKYRMRFLHSENFLSRKARQEARVRGKELRTYWEDVRKSLSHVCRIRGYELDALLLKAMDDIANSFERILSEIEGVYTLYERTNPDLVLLRDSVSGQTHFSILPLVAKEMGIPSLELQHGVGYFGPGSIGLAHHAEHIAVYGPLIKRELLQIGYDSKLIHAVGLPRFDRYRPARHEGVEQSVTILCIAPDISPFEIYDSYSALNYFSAVAGAVGKLRGVHVIIKRRSDPADRGVIRALITQAFGTVSHTVANLEPVSELLPRVDVVISCFSTAILEALVFGKPVIIPTLNPIDSQMVQFHFASYARSGAVTIAATHEQLVQSLTKLADSSYRARTQERISGFLATQFCFDGKSSKRCAALILRLSQKALEIHI